MTYFFYWYDALSGAHLQETDGMRFHLLPSPTPSWQSVAWHRQQLLDMKYAGIDIALPVYWGMERQEDGWSWEGLNALVQAADSLDEAPKLGLFLDTTIVNARDLTSPSGHEWFYNQFAEFFSRVPRPRWALVDGRPLALLFTSDFTWKQDQTTFDYVYARFTAEFGVRPYIVREESWDFPFHSWTNGVRDWDRTTPTTTDAKYVWGAAMHEFQNVGAIVAVGPGFDDHLVPGRGTGTVVDREGGARYLRNLAGALASNKSMVVIETWNEMHEGSGICEAVEYGRTYLDMTRTWSAEFHRRGA